MVLIAALSVSAKGKKQLVILHTNDTHSCIMPLNPHLADTMLAGRGGFLRRIAMLKEERRKNPDLLYFDSGDFCQGSPYYTMFKGDVEIGLMNQMGIDASTIGNHEFDFGLENMTVCEGLVKPYIILKRKGVKIGVFALDPKMEGLVSKTNCEGVKFIEPVKVANEMATMLKKEKKCDMVILISHLGWTDDAISDQNVIANSRYIDLVLGGHSHTYFQELRYVKNLDGKEIPVDQNGKHAIFVGKMTVTLSK